MFEVAELAESIGIATLMLLNPEILSSSNFDSSIFNISESADDCAMFGRCDLLAPPTRVSN